MYARPLNTISQRQRAHRPGSGLTDESRELVLAGEQNLVHALARDLRERDREPADDQSDRRQEQQHLPARDELIREQTAAHHKARHDRDGDRQGDRPPELTARQVTERGSCIGPSA